MRDASASARAAPFAWWPGSGRPAAARTLIFCSLALAGCAVGPDFLKPAPPAVDGFVATGATPPAQAGRGATAQRLVVGADIPGQWWDIFHSQPLTTLITRALAQNQDLKAAQAALRAARETAQAQRGLSFPQLGANFNPTGGKVGNAESSPLASGATVYSLTTAQLTVSYTPDVFGLNQREVESADALAEAQRFQLEAAYLTLTSNLVLAAVQEASLRAQIDATRKVIAIETELLGVLRRQMSLGQIAGGDVLVQEAALAQAQQSLPPLEKQLGIERDLLTALAGQLPSDEIAEHFDFATLHLPRELPVSLPSSLVAHRPDIQAAEANLHSASALVGVAVANRLPVISLTAQGGSAAANLAHLFSPPTAFYTLSGNVAQTIFDGGTLLHKQKAAEAQLDQAYAQYKSTVIVAFQNVGDALRALDADARALQAATAAETAALRSLTVARRQLALGQVANIVVLNAQQTYQQALLTRVQAQANRFSDTAALFQALGGGWWNRLDVADEKG
jgi:NodT family efflux transporter outer membrane factor (OMF) lipoprotein